MRPLVSVILTSYNHCKFIGESIRSVLNQTYPHFELIIVDDCSTDSSWKVINTFTDPRIVKIRHETNRMATTTLNNAIKHVAKGELIAIHHSDDEFCATKLEKQVSYLEQNPKIAAVFTHVEMIGESGSKLSEDQAAIFSQPNRTRHEWLHHFYFNGNCLCHPSVLIRKECYENVGLYNRGYGSLPDFDMWIRICQKYEIAIIQEKLIRFRILNNAQNTSACKPSTFIRSLNELMVIYNNYLNIKDVNEFKKIFPESKAYPLESSKAIPFVLGHLSTHASNKPGPLDVYAKGYNMFGLNLLYKIMNDEENAAYISKVFKFDYMELVNLSATIDPYNFEYFMTADKYPISSKNSSRLIDKIKAIINYTMKS